MCYWYVTLFTDLIKIGEETDVTLEDVVKEHKDRDERNQENFYKVSLIYLLSLNKLFLLNETLLICFYYSLSIELSYAWK